MTKALLTWQDLAERWSVKKRQARNISESLGLKPLMLAEKTPRFRFEEVIKAERKAGS